MCGFWRFQHWTWRLWKPAAYVGVAGQGGDLCAATCSQKDSVLDTVIWASETAVPQGVTVGWRRKQRQCVTD